MNTEGVRSVVNDLLAPFGVLLDLGHNAAARTLKQKGFMEMLDDTFKLTVEGKMMAIELQKSVQPRG